MRANGWRARGETGKQKHEPTAHRRIPRRQMLSARQALRCQCHAGIANAVRPPLAAKADASHNARPIRDEGDFAGADCSGRNPSGGSGEKCQELKRRREIRIIRREGLYLEGVLARRSGEAERRGIWHRGWPGPFESCRKKEVSAALCWDENRGKGLGRSGAGSAVRLAGPSRPTRDLRVLSTSGVRSRLS